MMNADETKGIITAVSLDESAAGPSLHEPSSVMYFGHQSRIPSADYDTPRGHDRDVAWLETVRVVAMMHAHTRRDGTPIEWAADLPIERISTIDLDTGDFLVTWRVPFRLVQKELRA